MLLSGLFFLYFRAKEDITILRPVESPITSKVSSMHNISSFWECGCIELCTVLQKKYAAKGAHWDVCPAQGVAMQAWVDHFYIWFVIIKMLKVLACDYPLWLLQT